MNKPLIDREAVIKRLTPDKNCLRKTVRADDLRYVISLLGRVPKPQDTICTHCGFEMNMHECNPHSKTMLPKEKVTREQIMQVLDKIYCDEKGLVGIGLSDRIADAILALIEGER